MTIRHLCFWYLLFIGPSVGEMADNVVDLIPEDMELLCPSKNVCRRNNSSQSPRLDIPELYQQCCTDCSCSEDCGDIEPCCFPWMDKRATARWANQKCIASLIGSSKFRKPTAYYMAIGPSVLDKQASSSHSNMTHSSVPNDCSDVAIAAWGSLFPVSSKKSRQIYINSHCAEADGIGVKEYVQWKPYITCLISNVLKKGQNLFSQLISKTGELSPGCYIQFSPPADIKDIISTEECFNDVIEVCHNGNITLPEYLNMTGNDVREACESGFYSPFVHGDIYPNVFCFLCNFAEFFVAGRMVCSTGTMDPLGPGKSGTMSMLLNTDLYVSTQETTDEKRHSKPLVCDSNDMSLCKEKLCPNGQEYDQNLNCQFTSSSWNRIRLRMIVFLTPAKPLNASLLRAVSVSAPFKSWLRSPWSDNWKIPAVLLRDVDVLRPNADSPHGQLIVFMTYMKPGRINPKQLMSSVTKSIAEDFQVCVEEECIEFKQKFCTYAKFTPLFDKPVLPLGLHIWIQKGFPDNITALDTQVPAFTVLFLDYNVLKADYEDRFIVGKMETCPQIALTPDEFQLCADDMVLFYERHELLLYEREFELVRTSIGQTHARICVDQTRFVDKHRHSKSSPTLISVQVILLALTLTRWFRVVCTDTSIA